MKACRISYENAAVRDSATGVMTDTKSSKDDWPSALAEGLESDLLMILVLYETRINVLIVEFSAEIRLLQLE